MNVENFLEKKFHNSNIQKISLTNDNLAWQVSALDNIIGSPSPVYSAVINYNYEDNYAEHNPVGLMIIVFVQLVAIIIIFSGDKKKKTEAHVDT